MNPTFQRAKERHKRTANHFAFIGLEGITSKTLGDPVVSQCVVPRDYKGDREGIPHIHPIP